MNKENSSATPYGDVFKTLLTDCPRLIIPVVNELFGKSYKRDEKVELRQNERFRYPHETAGEGGGNAKEKRITDSSFTIGNDSYHVECQTNPDKTILLRMYEYDSAIAIANREVRANRITIDFPASAVIYLRPNSKTPDRMLIRVRMPNGESASYEIPILKVKSYSLDELTEKELFFLYPFHLFSYESEMKRYEEDEAALKSFRAVLEDMVSRLEEANEDKRIDSYSKSTIASMIKTVGTSLAKRNERTREEVESYMGGQVLEYEVKTAWREGVKEGRSEGISEGAFAKARSVAKNMIAKGMMFSDIADVTGLSEEEVLAMEKSQE